MAKGTKKRPTLAELREAFVARNQKQVEAHYLRIEAELP